MYLHLYALSIIRRFFKGRPNGRPLCACFDTDLVIHNMTVELVYNYKWCTVDELNFSLLYLFSNRKF